MAIVSILKSALKSLPWKSIATTALEHAPDLYQKARKHFQKGGDQGSPPSAEAELNERITRLESLLLEQEALIREQKEKSAMLVDRCKILEARLFSFKIVSVLLFVAAMILLALLMK